MVKRVPIAVAECARRLLRMTDELESVSDEAATILKVTRRLRKESQWFSPSSQELLLGVHDRVAAFAACVSGYLKSPRRRRRRVEDVRQDEVDYLPESGVYYLRCLWWGCFHNPVGCRKSPPDATLNFHPFANAVSEWDANVIKI